MSANKPYPQYEACELDIICPDGTVSGWAVKHIISGEWVFDLGRDPEDELVPWLAKTRKCAIAYVRFLNCLTDEEPRCLCDD